MTDMFGKSANLGGVLESGKQLEVTDVVHKAFIEVTEKGTEAGASTGESYSHISFYTIENLIGKLNKFYVLLVYSCS